MPASNPKATPDVERALVDPSAVFAAPENVLSSPGLSRQQRIEILRRWHDDATDISVAVEEGMPGGEETLLRRITLALESLTGPVDPERTGASKHHGLAPGAIGRKG
jgi:hypothetical protein